MRTARLASAALGVLWLAAVGAIPATAEDEEEMTFEQKIIHGLLTGLGSSNSGIDYRERSPRVVPPSLNLPPPETTSSVDNNPAWPRDPDRLRARTPPAKLLGARDAARKADDSLVLLPSELDRPGAARGAGRVTTPERDHENTSGRPLAPSALGYKGGIFGTLFGKSDDKTVFAGEPPRNSLTDPPVGYQTPSPTQPYGVKEKSWVPKAFNPFDRGTHDP
jgi:hypothetical protein